MHTKNWDVTQKLCHSFHEVGCGDVALVEVLVVVTTCWL